MRLWSFRVADVSELERIESVKAGIFGAIAFTITYLVTLVLNYSLWENGQVEIVTLGLKVAIAFVSGFLFAVTYRYVIRNDVNSHLKDGVVFAFGLVRGLVPFEISPHLVESFGRLSLFGIESIICFAITRFSLDFALHRCWIKPLSF